MAKLFSQSFLFIIEMVVSIHGFVGKYSYFLIVFHFSHLYKEVSNKIDDTPHTQKHLVMWI